MMEWVLLVVLVPAIVIPIVLLFGFAGCDLIFELKDPVTRPGNLTAIPDSRSAITLRWEYTGLDAARFEVSRKRSTDATFEVVSPTDLEVTVFSDTGLDEGTSFDYQVVTVEKVSGDRSGPEEITRSTMGKVFEAMLPDELPGPNRCVVQRIEPARLARSGTRVQLTLQSPSVGALLINQLSISHAAATGDPYDSDGPPTLLVGTGPPLLVPADPAGGPFELPAFDFELDSARPLLVAFDSSAQAQVRLLTGVSLTEAAAFASATGIQEAALADRQPGYTQLNIITLVQRIDAG